MTKLDGINAYFMSLYMNNDSIIFPVNVLIMKNREALQSLLKIFK